MSIGSVGRRSRRDGMGCTVHTSAVSPVRAVRPSLTLHLRHRAPGADTCSLRPLFLVCQTLLTDQTRDQTRSYAVVSCISLDDPLGGDSGPKSTVQEYPRRATPFTVLMHLCLQSPLIFALPHNNTPHVCHFNTLIMSPLLVSVHAQNKNKTRINRKVQITTGNHNMEINSPWGINSVPSPTFLLAARPTDLYVDE